MKKIALIEDDEALSGELVNLLENNGFLVSRILDYAHAAEKVAEVSPDLLLLDIMLPKGNGQSVLRELRKRTDLPVIMLTGKNTDTDEIMGMANGADDYITKPYHPALLLLRIEALLRRAAGEKKQEIFLYRGAEFNLLRSSLLRDGKEILLSKNEMMIFYCLLQNQGKIVSRDQLMDFLWDCNEFVDDNTLTVNINRLRKRLSELGLCECIQTHRKQGYLLL